MSDRKLIPLDITPLAFDPTNERAVAGLLLLDGDRALAAIGGDIGDLFFDALAKAAHDTFHALRARGIPANVPTVTSWLLDHGQLEAVGGAPAVQSLANELTAAHVSSVGYHVEQMRDHKSRRDLLSLKKCLDDAGVSNDEWFRQIGEHLERRKPHSTLPPIDDFAGMLEEAIAEPPEVVVGFMHRGSKAVVGGGSKSFKTWMLADLGLSVSTGTSWLGFPTIRGRVCYINLEIHRGFFHSRLKSIRQARQLRVEKGYLRVWTLRGHAADLSALVPEIIRQCEQEGFSLIIVDPIYKVLGGRDENAAGDIGGLLNEIERLAVQTGAAVAFGAHFSKGNQAAKESIDRIGGSGVYARDPDSILVLTKHEEEEAFTVEATLRNHAPIEPFVVKWQFPVMHRADELDPAKLKQAGGRPKVHDADELFRVLGKDEKNYSEWLADAKKHAGMSKGTFTALKKELLQTGRVHQSEITQKYEQVKKVNNH